MANSFDFNYINQAPNHSSASPPMSSPGRAGAAYGFQQQPQQHFELPSSYQTGPGSGNVTIYQTTGPNAHLSPLMSPGGREPALNPRSCVTCRKRKVRCDKQMPCSNCRRGQIPCVFPAPGRAPRQPRPKDPNAPPKNTSQREIELVKRLRKLEEFVEELSGQIEVDGGRSDSALDSGISSDMSKFKGTSDSTDDETKRSSIAQPGRLVVHDQRGNTRYVTTSFWSSLNDEVRDILILFKYRISLKK